MKLRNVLYDYGYDKYFLSSPSAIMRRTFNDVFTMLYELMRKYQFGIAAACCAIYIPLTNKSVIKNYILLSQIRQN